VDVALALHYDPTYAVTLSASARDAPGAISEDGESELRVRIEDYTPNCCAWLTRRVGTSDDATDTGLTGSYGIDAVLIAVKATLNSLHDEGQTWRQIAALVEVSPALVHQVAHGKFEHVSWETIRAMSSKLSNIDPGPITFTLGGKSIAVVGRKRKQYWRPCLDSDLRAAVARDRRAGETDTDVFFRWLDMT
jgi:hypothetical protein